MTANPPDWFTQDTLPQAGLCLDRHLIPGTRPADGTSVIAACGIAMVVRPAPECDVDGDLRLVGVRPCWYCVDRAAGRRPTGPRRPAAEDGLPPSRRIAGGDVVPVTTTGAPSGLGRRLPGDAERTDF
ncbi:hypothetical protein FHR81_000082 [Actinoalloteichus hoggarensis]|uniref:Uncharacterized protein n=1 Tax=Actinoalloteichus hoggarensis TaxID=1470176 RepID=A0A221W3I3_9PSEU|nr:hypothetical protein [Actinoalloteichus hoggarensis]ASO20233.1 hypothetical protein AHOG_12950 [Actinoalloteichus hoggarensis]MBB5919053.1 hypothetical protein [Actinoalloteichus hoggarensis]